MTWMKELRLDAAVSSSETPDREELRVIVGGPTLEDAPGEDLRKSVGEALMCTLEDGKGAGLGVHV
jgi:hypothetical protein